MATAKKISALETEEEFFRKRLKRTDLRMFEDILYYQDGEMPCEREVTKILLDSV
ncbi:hypothetical protein [Nitrosomonas sp.]|uniref:hypothetical protein n=1 Tax=Nitrosomonas sp. TaxID=42353 RepID=UPI00207E4F36|nr:hypothetical protein [Nitrosomonas sp.]GJL75538.1 MAG: hypothetical protein NMNS02_16440 [Nitrosomonas sp.]